VLSNKAQPAIRGGLACVTGFLLLRSRSSRGLLVRGRKGRRITNSSCSAVGQAAATILYCGGI